MTWSDRRHSRRIHDIVTTVTDHADRERHWWTSDSRRRVPAGVHRDVVPPSPSDTHRRQPNPAHLPEDGVRVTATRRRGVSLSRYRSATREDRRTNTAISSGRRTGDSRADIVFARQPDPHPDIAAERSPVGCQRPGRSSTVPDRDTGLDGRRLVSPCPGDAPLRHAGAIA